MAFRGVIFDMDGLLFDSERIGIIGIQECGRLQGFDIPEEMIKQTLGSTSMACRSIYREHLPGMDADRLFADFADNMRIRARQKQIPLMRGARELLQVLKERAIPCAVASSSPEEFVRLYLESQGIIDHFSVILGGPAGIRSKPQPDIFLLAAQELGVPAGDCLVLQDSVNGIRAGRASGATVVMVPDQIPYSEALSCYVDRVCESLLEVKDVFFS